LLAAVCHHRFGHLPSLQTKNMAKADNKSTILVGKVENHGKNGKKHGKLL